LALSRMIDADEEDHTDECARGGVGRDASRQLARDQTRGGRDRPQHGARPADDHGQRSRIVLLWAWARSEMPRLAASWRTGFSATSRANMSSATVVARTKYAIALVVDRRG